MKIETEADYEQALKRAYKMLSYPHPSGLDPQELKDLVAAIEAYEKIHYPISYPSLIEAAKYYFESRNLKVLLKRRWREWRRRSESGGGNGI